VAHTTIGRVRSKVDQGRFEPETNGDISRTTKLDCWVLFSLIQEWTGQTGSKRV